VENKKAIFFALFLTVGSNWLMTAQNAWVWFIAQNMAFTLSLMAIYYALKNKAGLSLAFWACAVGCRPFQALYIPVLLYLLYKAHKEQNPDDKLIDIIKKRWLAVIPMAIIALSYMILNFARFGNITEFGHNYLPEFTRTTTGQFNVSYLKENIKNLFRLPSIESGEVEFPSANGFCFFIVSPIIIFFIALIIKGIIKKDIADKKIIVIISLIIIAELFGIVMHKTMGGSHFGNRYTNDILPLVFLGIGTMLNSKYKSLEMLSFVLFVFGLCLNLLGSTLFYLNLL
jgi:hypothetical protein